MPVKCIHIHIPISHSKTGVYLFLLKNLDFGFSLKLPRQGGSKVYPPCMFLAKIKKNVKKFLLKIFIFYNLEKCFRKLMVIISHFTFVFLLNIKVVMIRLFQTIKHVAF